MTIRDMIESGIEFQGDYRVRAYDYENDSYIEYDPYSDEALDREVKYIYSTSGSCYDYTIEVEYLSKQC